MAKSQTMKNSNDNKKSLYPYQSRFGSTSDMIVKENEDGTLVLKDEFGEYTTKRLYVDTNMADPFRFDLNHRKVSL